MLRTTFNDQLNEIAAGLAELKPVYAHDEVRRAVEHSTHAIAFFDADPSRPSDWTEEKAVTMLSSAMQKAGIEVAQADRAAKRAVDAIMTARDNILITLARS